MRSLKVLTGVLACITLIALTSGGALAETLAGTIKSVKVEYCGIAPGDCVGSVVLAKADGAESTVQIDSGSRLFRKNHEGKAGDPGYRYTLGALMITQLRAGDKIKVDAHPRKGELWVANLVVQ